MRLRGRIIWPIVIGLLASIVLIAIMFATMILINRQMVAQASATANTVSILDNLRNIGTVISEDIVAMINLSLIISFFYTDRQFKQIEQKNACRIYWFRNFILEKNFEEIDKFYACCYDVADRCSIIIKNVKLGEYSVQIERGNWENYK